MKFSERVLNSVTKDEPVIVNVTSRFLVLLKIVVTKNEVSRPRLFKPTS